MRPESLPARAQVTERYKVLIQFTAEFSYGNVWFLLDLCENQIRKHKISTAKEGVKSNDILRGLKYLDEYTEESTNSTSEQQRMIVVCSPEPVFLKPTFLEFVRTATTEHKGNIEFIYFKHEFYDPAATLSNQHPRYVEYHDLITQARARLEVLAQVLKTSRLDTMGRPPRIHWKVAT